MAANTTIQLKKSATPSAIPDGLAYGELAINYADGKLYYKNVNNYIVEFTPQTVSNYFGSISANGTLVIADTTGDVFTLTPGDNISIVGDALNDIVTIAAKLDAANAWTNTQIALVFDKTNSAYAQANTARDHANAAFAKANTGGGGGGGGASVSVGTTAPNDPSSGDLWYNSNLGKLFIYYDDGDTTQWVETSSNYITANTPTPSVGSLAWKSASIEYPETYNKVPLFFTANAITVQQIVPAVVGVGLDPSVTFSVRFGANPNDTGTEVKVNGININSSNNGTVFTTFDYASVPANNYIWATISYATAATDWLNLTIGF